MSECNCKSELLEKIITTFKEELESCESSKRRCDRYYPNSHIAKLAIGEVRQAERAVKILERFREE